MSKLADQKIKESENFDDTEYELITCICDDPNCPKTGSEGENGHIENCPCYECHYYYGKIRPLN